MFKKYNKNFVLVKKYYFNNFFRLEIPFTFALDLSTGVQFY